MYVYRFNPSKSKVLRCNPNKANFIQTLGDTVNIEPEIQTRASGGTSHSHHLNEDSCINKVSQFFNRYRLCQYSLSLYSVLQCIPVSKRVWISC